MNSTDLESETQWRVRYDAPGTGAEIIRTGNEVRVRKMAEMFAVQGSIIEVREIVVGEWSEATLHEEPECSHSAWTHIGSERYCASCGIDRDSLDG